MIKQPFLYTSVCILLLVVEILFVSLSVDAKSLTTTGHLSWLLAHAGSLLRWLIASASVFILFLLLFDKGHSLKSVTIKVAPWYYWLLHLLIFSGFALLTLEIFKRDSNAGELILWAWLLLAALNIATWLGLMFSRQVLFTFCRNNYRFLLLSLAIGLVISISVLLMELLFEPLSLFTLHSSSIILSQFFADVYVDIPNRLLALNDFIVHVSTACSGFEGLIIVLSMTAIFLYTQREELAFPVSFVLLPIAALLSLTFNILRVSVLMIIGEFVSADLAIQGFHSVAGWISAAIVSFLILFCFSSWSVLYRDGTKTTKATGEVNSDSDGDLAWAILVPFVVSLFLTLFNQIFNQGFDYLYPIKAGVVMVLLLYFWKTYKLQLPAKNLEPIAAGLLIAVLWVFLVPENEDYNQTFMASLAEMTNMGLLFWFVFRFVGFWLVAPIIEELVFRCYLVARLSNKTVSITNNLQFSWIATVISSVIFGLMHTSFWAGLMAGLIFMAVRYRSSSLSAPILAHMVANFALSVWAFNTGNWALI